MANELLKNSDGDAVPQFLDQNSTLSASNLTGDDSNWSIFKDPAQGGGSTLQDVVDAFDSQSPVVLQANDSADNGSQQIQRLDGTRALKVGIVNQITAADGNTIKVLGEDQNGNAVPISVDADGVVNVQDASAEAFLDGATLASGSEVTTDLSQSGAETLSGIVLRQNTAYDVLFRWLDSPGGNTIIEEPFSTGVSGGSLTQFAIPAPSPYVQVVVADNGGGTGAVNASFHLR